MAVGGYPEPVPVNKNPHARAALVPVGAASLLLCRYLGESDPTTAGTLAGSHLVRASSSLARLEREFNALPPIPPGTYHCLGDGAFILAVFRYAHAPADSVRVDVNGCRTVTNGFLKRRAVFPPGLQLIKQLQRLTANHG